MKRKLRSLLTGGLLGLAGLGLLPRGAEASTDQPAVSSDVSLGEALAENPSPVIAPEPSAQATAPQVEEQQPAWSQEDEQQSAVITAASAAASAPAPDVALAVAEPAIVPAEDTAAVPEPTSPAEARVIEATPSPTPAVVDAAAQELANLPVQPVSTAADVVIAPQVAPSLEASIAISPAVVENPPQKAIAPPAEQFPELSPQPEAVKPLLPTAELSQPVAAPVIAASPRREASPRAVEPAIAIAPNPALTAPANSPVNSAPTLAPATRPTAPDLAALRARSVAVQALIRDLRATAGLDENAARETPVAAPSHRVSQGRGPQLPPLPSTAAAETQNGQPSLRRAPQRPRQLSPQLPDVSARATDVALSLPAAQPVMSPAPAETIVKSSMTPSSMAPTTIAQTTSGADAAQIRDDLQIAPLTTTANPRRTFGPSPNAGIPSGFGANGGDIFFSASLSGADRVRPELDGSLSMGFGLGDSRQVVGLELAYNLLSVRRFGENGNFDAKIHRQVYSSDETEVAAAVGLNNFASYGSNTVGTPSSLYGVVTAAHLLQPEHPVNRMPITGTLGLGGGNFSGEGSDVGVIAGVGLQVHPQFSFNTAWSGVGLNVGASIVPVPTMPLTLNLLYGDVGNNTQAGSVAVLSIGYGFNFGPQF